MSQAPRFWQQTAEGKAKISAHQKALAAKGLHWTQTPEGKKHMAKIATKGAKWTKTTEGRKRIGATSKHWTQTAEGRAHMSKIAKIRNAAQGKNNGKKAVPWGAHRTDIPLKTRALIAKQYNGGQVNSPELARRHGISMTTVRTWAQEYGRNGARKVRAGDVKPGVHWTQTREGRARMAELARRRLVGRQSRNGLNRSNRARTMSTQACGACRTCLLCQKLGVEPQWIMCLVANPLEGGVV